MKQEDKQLLLQDFCARLPYGFKYQVQYGDTSVRDVNKFILDGEYSLFDTWMVQEIKPYLRPMSSMTVEEEVEWFENVVPTMDCDKQLDFYCKYHFDYRGLIEKGLALVAPDGMYNNQ